MKLPNISVKMARSDYFIFCIFLGNYLVYKMLPSLVLNGYGFFYPGRENSYEKRCESWLSLDIRLVSFCIYLYIYIKKSNEIRMLVHIKEIS